MEFSSRMKDYYDIYYLSHKFDFDGKVLTEALAKTFVNRDHSFTLEQFEQVIHFNQDEAMIKKWNAFAHKLDTKTDEFSTVLNGISDFLEKPFTALIENKEFNQKWSAQIRKWN